MEEKRDFAPADSTLLISRSEADALIGLKDAKAALLYIYMLRNEGKFDREAAARDLAVPLGEVDKAACALMSLLAPGKKTMLFKPDAPPEYTAEEISASIREKADFAGLVQETQRRLGKMLSGTELSVLFGIYDYLGMPSELILLLITHCKEEYSRRYGEGRSPTLRFIEKEAYAWARMEILTQERAEEHLRRRAESRRKTEEIKRLLQIKNRELSPSERKYISSWIEMGFCIEAIELAYDRTVIKTGGLNWAYMNSILKSWHSKGLHTISEIEKGDSPAGTRRQDKSSGAPTREEYERMKRYLEKIKQE